eukprot:CAMPEP_0174356074 /NCGR_PEP_ID=MMETSP0811_2-20130205/28592_1 /TAXON_ID=73025 ORGANISM="Eutreptiella gymnastica-like, Strain CCMP1594" /NCGR_SAMPLE_ID=MMETSP0811_2 /ASSEMBLY_ACC=CAM_ASM_000667 /LENGTH=76 /DNA_ID=CAMNT_0015487891 /DNA_START=74 /DNA_END=304 /DNA_ORIENTATION=+
MTGLCRQGMQREHCHARRPPSAPLVGAYKGLHAEGGSSGVHSTDGPLAKHKSSALAVVCARHPDMIMMGVPVPRTR